MTEIQSLWDAIDSHNIRLVVFDMDDTLYPEYDYVLSGFEAVAEQLQIQYGVERASEKLRMLFDENPQQVFNRLLDAEGIGYTQNDILRCVSVYKQHKPTLRLTTGAEQLLSALKEKGISLGMITDGNPVQQQNKFDALGLVRWIDRCILTDSLGGEQYRKPHPVSFEMLHKHFGVPFHQMMYVGDNPKKDFAVRNVHPIVTVHYQGETRGIYQKESYRDGILPNYILHEMK